MNAFRVRSNYFELKMHFALPTCATTALLILFSTSQVFVSQINGTHACKYGSGGGSMSISGFSSGRNINPVVRYKGKTIIFGEVNTGGTFRAFHSGDWRLAIGGTLSLTYLEKLVCSSS